MTLTLMQQKQVQFSNCCVLPIETCFVVHKQGELSNFIEGVNPFVQFTEAQLSIILEEVCQWPIFLCSLLTAS